MRCGGGVKGRLDGYRFAIWHAIEVLWLELILFVLGDFVNIFYFIHQGA